MTGRRPEQGHLAHVRVTGSGAGRLRRLADSEVDGVLTINYLDIAGLSGIIAGAGAAARALDPPELIDAVRSRLRAVARPR